MSVAQGQPRRLTTEPYKYMSYAEVSPDGSEILYDGTPAGETNGLYIVPSLGGSGRRIAEPGIGARWRPDARRIGYIRTGSYRDLVPSQSGGVSSGQSPRMVPMIDWSSSTRSATLQGIGVLTGPLTESPSHGCDRLRVRRVDCQRPGNGCRAPVDFIQEAD